jgi:hypothetical protein
MKLLYKFLPPDVMVLLRIREVPGSDLGPETGYPDEDFCGFSQSLRSNAGIVT